MAIADAVKALEEAFPSQVLLPGTPEYTELSHSYLSVLESDITPACIFRPTSNEEISTFLKLTRGTPFAIRGGGQQPLPGCANIPDGITLDLGLLTDIEVNEDTSTISIAAVERWGNAYDVLAPKNLAVTGGRSAKGGIGGLALQGGLSFFSSREGFICDNVLSYEIILASGLLITANATSHPDLWLALRGGANNFGIVTRYHMRIFAQTRFWGASIYYFSPSFPSQIDNMVDELTKADASHDTHSDVEYRAAVAMEGMRCAYMNITLKASSPALKTAADIYTSSLEPIKSKEGLICSLTLQPYPISLLEKSIELGGNFLGLSPADGPLVSVLLLTYWKNREDDEQILGLMKGVLGRIDAEAKEEGQVVGFTFMNYASGFQDPVASYGVENMRRLQGVSRKYDPEGVFQRLVPRGGGV
ncbi:hypothetical protein ASPCADRAFT_513492 [Aspergillus carbonarius ITEM 5010]|uniref:FAD-binding PCMH-type domain-containing protein n=1 Tax=Aspergillus carbonarius (strain ITEM 5010) TaxID=602072 RepID=A0A1R3RTL5_ASPC5|nr:hypothetical protein ASPCADRAFT_513492 [Aspergillus carbonarius ITEM 5010]